MIRHIDLSTLDSRDVLRLAVALERTWQIPGRPFQTIPWARRIVAESTRLRDEEQRWARP